MDEQTIDEPMTTSPSRRVTRVERVRRVADLSVGQLSLRELHAELQRRITQLQEQKRELLDKIDEIELELTEIGGMTAGAAGAAGDDAESVNGRRGRRARNEVPLADMLAEMLKGRPLTTREAADTALEAGYQTTSKNFVNSVGVALHRDERFFKEDGRWCVADEASS